MTGGTLVQEAISISDVGDLSAARLMAKSVSTAIGFDERAVEEIALVVSELATNLVKHAKAGILRLQRTEEGGRTGIQIDSEDKGPGIPNVEQAIADDFSTVGSLGCGLGAVNRLMDEFDIASRPGAGTSIVCKRWLRLHIPAALDCPLVFGVATRPCPLMPVNGDSFVIQRWGESALVGVIDGVGHGQFAYRAAQAARHYVERHYDQPLADIFMGVARACRATRGVVMGLARFDWGQGALTFASVGNVEARVFDSPEPMNFVVPRGILGLTLRRPVVTQHRWAPSNVMVLYSDGLSTHWRWSDFPHLAEASATVAAQELLHAFAREADDATIVVIKRRGNLAGASERAQAESADCQEQWQAE
jgi:anti-sigma regulatory factor (Ser/Thr protein kinase)/serine/threonine protein phosphatase PrpC